jgi:putative heme-binding domain-containing protein
MINGQGGVFGPVLSDIGWLRGAPYLRQALVEPGAVLPSGSLPIPSRGYKEYLPVRVVAADGRTVTGVRLNEDVFTIQLRDASGRMHSFRKSEAKSIQKEEGISLMPAYGDRIKGDDLDDLVAYLSTLGGTR